MGDFVEKSLDWFNENQDNINSREFERVWVSEGDVSLSADELAKVLNYETEAALVVNGNLVVDGRLSVDDHHSVQVIGDVKCRSFWVASGVFECKKLEVAEWLEFPCDDTQRMETLDIGSIEAPIVIAKYIDVADLASNVSARFTCNDVDDETKTFDQLLQQQFAAVLAALEAGETIDDGWVAAHKHLVS